MILPYVAIPYGCFIFVCIFVTFIDPVVGVFLLLLCVAISWPLIREVRSILREHRQRRQLLALVERNLREKESR